MPLHDLLHDTNAPPADPSSVKGRTTSRSRIAANPGLEWRPKGRPECVNIHDFQGQRLGKAIPYGVYDLSVDGRWVVGIDHHTPPLCGPIHSHLVVLHRAGDSTPNGRELLKSRETESALRGPRRPWRARRADGGNRGMSTEPWHSANGMPARCSARRCPVRPRDVQSARRAKAVEREGCRLTFYTPIDTTSGWIMQTPKQLAEKSEPYAPVGMQCSGGANWKAGVTVSLVALLTTLGGVELGLRILWTNPYANLRDRFIYMFEPKPNTDITYTWPWGQVRYRVEPDGYIYPSRVYHPADTTVVFLGGSTTECIAVPELERFPYLVGVELSKKLGRKVNTLNAGVSGANTQHAINVLFNKIRFEHPDYVVMMHATNDLGALQHNGSYQPYKVVGESHLAPVFILNALAANSSVFGFGRWASMHYKHSDDAVQIQEHHSSGDDAVSEAQCGQITGQFRQNLLAFVNLSRNLGLKPVLMTEARDASRGRSGTGGDFFAAVGVSADCYDAMNATTRAVARESGTKIIDLAQELSEKSDSFYDGLHYTAIGSKRAASIISMELAASIESVSSVPSVGGPDANL